MEKPKINLFLFTNEAISIDWPIGDAWAVNPNVGSVCAELAKYINASAVEGWLFWDGSLGMPDPERIQAILELPGDLWHAGLRMGMSGLPRLMDYVAPTWMLNCDPPPGIEATSWRVSLRACLVRSEVLRQVGFIRSDFLSLDGAAVEWGHRCIMSGVTTRHIPSLLPENVAPGAISLPYEDELRFIRACYKPIWTKWAVVSSLLARPQWFFRILRSWHIVQKTTKDSLQIAYNKIADLDNIGEMQPTITVILPTLERYEYLEKCLSTLRQQTIKPHEIICVDQNTPENRPPELYEKFYDLPIRLILQDGKGQSLARNGALEVASGDWIFFADDDSEYPADTLEQHLRLVFSNHADGSTGLSLPPYPYHIPLEYQHERVAYNLDTGNALIRKSVVIQAGGFDRNYDFGKGADTDLGTRLYLNGCLLLHNPHARRLHYKSGSGGLRKYGVMWETRQIPVSQPRPVATHTYWIMRYCLKRLWGWAIFYEIVFGNIPNHATKSISKWQIIAHYLREFFLLPLTCYQVYRSVQKARKYLSAGPRLLQNKKL